MVILLLMVLLVSTSLLAFADGTTEPGPGYIVCHVRDSNGNPISGATVELYGNNNVGTYLHYQGTTAAAGDYYFSSNAEWFGTWSLRASKDGYSSSSTGVQAGAVIDQGMEFLSRTLVLSVGSDPYSGGSSGTPFVYGTVYQMDQNGNLVGTLSGATVYFALFGNTVGSTTTSSIGYFRGDFGIADNPANFPMSATAVMTGYNSAVVSFSYANLYNAGNNGYHIGLYLYPIGYTPGATVTPTPTPTPTPVPTPNPGATENSIYGSIYDQYGLIVANMPVWLKYQNGSVMMSTTTDSNGNYELTFSTSGLSAQTFTVVPGSSETYNNTSRSAYVSYPFVAFGQSVTTYRCDISLKNNANYTYYTIKGYVYDAVTNLPLSGATLRLYGPNGMLITSVVVTSNNYYEMAIPSILDAGLYNLTISQAGYQDGWTGPFSYPDIFDYSNTPGTKQFDWHMIPVTFSNGYNNEIILQIYATDTGTVLRTAGYQVFYENGTLYSYGSMANQYYAYVRNVPPGNYLIKGSYTGYSTLTYSLTVAENNVYTVTLGLNAEASPTPYPTLPGQPTATPGNFGNFTLQKSIGDIATWFDTQFLGIDSNDRLTQGLVNGALTIFICILAFALIGVYLLQYGEVAKTATVWLCGIGGALGFIIACFSGMWPWWIIIVILVILAFLLIVWRYLMGRKSSGGGD